MCKDGRRGYGLVGFGISQDKVATIVGPSKVEAAIQVVRQEFLDRTGFKYLACGRREGHKNLVIVLDDDYNEENLRHRSLGEIHSSILWVKDVLDDRREQ